MICVTVPLHKIFMEVEDHESPWGTSEVVIYEVIEWIQERCDDAWDYDVKDDGIAFVFEDKDRDTALLFKLTWGGE
jgi:hypothetical protein